MSRQSWMPNFALQRVQDCAVRADAQYHAMAIPLKLNLKRWRSTDTAKCDCGLEHTTFLHQLGHTTFLHQQWGTQHFATTYGAQKEFASVGHDNTKIYSSEHKRHSRSSQGPRTLQGPRALCSKINFLHGTQAKNYVFYAEFQGLSDAIIAF